MGRLRALRRRVPERARPHRRGDRDAEALGRGGARSPAVPRDGPAPIEWPDDDGWVFTDPDVVLKMPEPYYVEDDIKDVYTKHRLVLTPDLLPEDKWVQEIEFRRGSELVHHFNIFVKSPGDEETRGDGHFLGGATSGSPPHVWPEGYGSLLRTGDTLTFDLHYHKEPGPGSGGWDQSSHRAQVRDEAGGTPGPLLPDQQLRVRDSGPPRLLA